MARRTTPAADGLPAAAARLASALRGLMGAEGGEPGPEPGQRAAWAEAERALEAYAAAVPMAGTCTVWPLLPCLPYPGEPDRHTHPGTTHGRPYMCPGRVRAEPFSRRHARRLMAAARRMNDGVRQMAAVDARANRAWALGPDVAGPAGVHEEPWPLGSRPACTCPADVVAAQEPHVAACAHHGVRP